MAMIVDREKKIMVVINVYKIILIGKMDSWS